MLYEANLIPRNKNSATKENKTEEIVETVVVNINVLSIVLSHTCNNQGFKPETKV